MWKYHHLGVSSEIFLIFVLINVAWQVLQYITGSGGGTSDMSGSSMQSGVSKSQLKERWASFYSEQICSRVEKLYSWTPPPKCLWITTNLQEP